MKESIQRFGRFLSAMVMPNIGAFIAWGLVTALFIPDGWLPNEQLATMVSPMLTYLLPLLVGYTGGNMVYGKRGAVVGAIGCFGVIVGAPIAMFIGCMAMGPFAAFIIKKIDQVFLSKIPSGFEMLWNNFSAGIIGTILAIIGLLVINPFTLFLTNGLAAGVEVLVNNGLLPLTSIFVEPAKVLFLNNAINHGIFTPLGSAEVLEAGKSIFYLIEANPGPGLGLLLAYMFFGKGMARSSASGAAIIHFFGGIHEIYFPFVLMNPFTIIALICGGASGVFINVLFDSGLTSAASPGSILAIIPLIERNSYVGVLLSILISAIVTFVIAAIIIKFTKDNGKDLDEATDEVKKLKGNKEDKKEEATTTSNITKITFACDAGMGSSAMGASILRKKFKEANINVEVNNCAIDVLPSDTQCVVTQHSFEQRVNDRVPNAKVYTIQNFMASKEYDRIIEEFSSK